MVLVEFETETRLGGAPVPFPNAGKAVKSTSPVSPAVSLAYALSGHRQLSRQQLELLLADELLRVLADIQKLLRRHCDAVPEGGSNFVATDAAQRLQEIIEVEGSG